MGHIQNIRQNNRLGGERPRLRKVNLWILINLILMYGGGRKNFWHLVDFELLMLKEEHLSKAIVDPIKICKKNKQFFQFENKNKSPLDKKIEKIKFKLYKTLLWMSICLLSARHGI